LDKIIEASETLRWLAEQASAPGEHGSKRMEMAMSLHLADLYVIEYGHHVARGAEPYDALMATALGEKELSQRQRDLLRSLVPIHDPDAAR